MTQSLLIESHYWPCIEYFVLFQEYQHVNIEVKESYFKQSYRNRCQILGANKVQNLVVPVIKSVERNIEHVCIDYSGPWVKDHWRSIESAYNRSPFFLYYKDEIREIYDNNYERLLDLNEAILTFCLKSLGWERFVGKTKEYQKDPNSVLIADYRGVISAKQSYLEREIMKPERYYQMFGKTFVNNLSIIDLLFCEGPQSVQIIRSSRKGPNK